MSEVFQRAVALPVTAAQAMAWHEQEGALERLTPPWERVQIIHHPGSLRDGTRAELHTRWGPFWLPWSVEHYGYESGRQFCDRQMSGVFAQWEHVHHFEDNESLNGCVMIDRIHYRLPGGPLGRLFNRHVQGRLDRLFAYRHEIIRADLTLPCRRRGRVLISGASGMLGHALVPLLQTQGWTVDRLVRRAAHGKNEITWIPDSGVIHWPEGYHCDAVIHLAGASIAGERWTAARRAVLHQSRIAGTRTLVSALSALEEAPRVLLSGSAIGIYGERGDALLGEDSGAGVGFLAGLCTDWEAEARRAEALGTRVVNLRTGIVLTPEGGALAKLLPLFQLGLGGALGDGQMWQSWISREDWLQAVLHALGDDEMNGPVNLVAPAAVRQVDFARVLGRVLHRPTVLPTPPGLLRLRFGELADEAILASARVEPGVLHARGFKFLHPSLEKALLQVLGKRP